jgi:hypothetical protein
LSVGNLQQLPPWALCQIENIGVTLMSVLQNSGIKLYHCSHLKDILDWAFCVPSIEFGSQSQALLG